MNKSYPSMNLIPMETSSPYPHKPAKLSKARNLNPNGFGPSLAAVNLSEMLSVEGIQRLRAKIQAVFSSYHKGENALFPLVSRNKPMFRHLMRLHYLNEKRRLQELTVDFYPTGEKCRSHALTVLKSYYNRVMRISAINPEKPLQ